MTPPDTALAGHRDAAREPLRQRGAYALVRDRQGRVLVVLAGNGRCYLPGGRLEQGEAPEHALAREIAEECGWSAEVGVPLGEREQAIFGGEVTLAASYWAARLTRPLAVVAEHRSLWLDPAEAARRLHRASDRQVLAACG